MESPPGQAVSGDAVSADAAVPAFVVRDGELREPGAATRLPAAVERAVGTVERELARRPFAAPEADDLARLGLGPKELAAAERAGRLVRLTEGVVLSPAALPEAVRVLKDLGEPFTVSRARRALDTTRRVAVPLLERLDADGHTVRRDDGTRVLRGTPEQE